MKDQEMLKAIHSEFICLTNQMAGEKEVPSLISYQYVGKTDISQLNCVINRKEDYYNELKQSMAIAKKRLNN